MKSFLMKFDESGNPTFVDEKDRAAYGRLLSSISSKCGGTEKAKFEMIIRLPEPKDINKNQINLFRVLVSLIKDQTGNDYHTIYNTLIENHFGSIKDLESVSTKEFSDFFESTLVFSRDFFGLNITYNEITRNLEILNE